MLGLGLNRDGGAGLAGAAAGLACNAGLSDGSSISCAPLPNNSSKSDSVIGSSVGLGLLATGLTLEATFEGLLMTRTRPGAGLKPTASGSTPARTNS